MSASVHPSATCNDTVATSAGSGEHVWAHFQYDTESRRACCDTLIHSHVGPICTRRQAEFHYRALLLQFTAVSRPHATGQHRVLAMASSCVLQPCQACPIGYGGGSGCRRVAPGLAQRCGGQAAQMYSVWGRLEVNHRCNHGAGAGWFTHARQVWTTPCHALYVPSLGVMPCLCSRFLSMPNQSHASQCRMDLLQVCPQWLML